MSTFVIWRAPFRWLRLCEESHEQDHAEVIPNAYEHFSAERICVDNEWKLLQLIHDDVAIVRTKDTEEKRS